MGNSPLDSLVTSTASSIGEDIPWSKQFTLLDKQPLNNTYILHHIPTNNSYKVKHMTLNKTQHSQIFRQIDIKKNTPSPFITKIQKTQQYTVKGYCSQHQEVFLMYKYVETNLKQEILNRRFKQQKFLQQQIKVILQAGVKGISYLHQIGCTPKGLNTSQILLTPQRAVLVNDPWLSMGSPLAQRKKDDTQSLSKIFSTPVEDYPSPQKILFMNELTESYNQWLSELFTFGMIVLETIFMTSLSEQMYDKLHKKIHYHKVKQKIEQIVEGQQLEQTIINVKDKKIQKNQTKKTSLLAEIKQDLRRLLSHEPKIRQSVYLKYKKNHNSQLLLKKSNNELNPQNETKQKLKDQLSGNKKQQFDKNNQLSNYGYNDKNLAPQYENDNDYRSRYFKKIQEGEKKHVSKQNWLLNSIDEQSHLVSKNKQPSNRFRVISSSVPKPSVQTVQLPKTSYDINHLGYRQLGGPTLGRVESKPIGNQWESNSRLNSLMGANYLQGFSIGSLEKNNYQRKPLSYSRLKQPTSQRTGELSPRKQTAVEKQTQPKWYNYKGHTASTIPSSNYLSNISSYQSQITPLFAHQNGKSLYENSTENTSNTYKNTYNSNILNLPPHMVTRSSSSYVMQQQSTGDKGLFSNHLSETQNKNWTYDTMVTNNFSHYPISTSYSDKTSLFLNNLPKNDQKQTSTQFKTLNNQTIPPHPSKISLSNPYSKYLSNENQPNINSSNLTPNCDLPSYNSPKYDSTTTFKPNYPNYSSTFNQSSYNFGDVKTYNTYGDSYMNKQQSQKIIQPSLIPKLPSSKELSNFQFREVGSLYCEDSHFLNDKQSIVIQSYNGGVNNKYLSANNRSQTPSTTLNPSYLPTPSPKDSFEINHSMIANARNDGKSFSSMDEDVKELRKFSQQREMIDKKPISSYSSSQKVSLIDKIYDPQVMGSLDRRSFENNSKQSYQLVEQGNRSSEDVNQRGSMEKNNHARNSSQNYLQTPERYPAKNKLNSTIREASCEDSGVNQSHNNSNQDSYEHERPHPNTEVSKYQLLQERRYSERKLQDNQRQHLKQYERLKQKETQPNQNGMKEASYFAIENKNNKRQIMQNDSNSNQVDDADTRRNSVSETQRVTLYADGSRYMGHTDQQGESHGHGTLYYPDGHIAYEGQWQHGDFNGKGRLFNPYELKMDRSYDYRYLTKMDQYIKEFEGTFLHDIKQGKGVLKMHNNETYEGQFSNDLPHGRGKFYCSDGNVVEGRWQRGHLQQIY